MYASKQWLCDWTWCSYAYTYTSESVAGFDTGFFARGGTILLIAYSGFSIVYIFFVGREEGKHTDCMYIIHEYLKPLRNMT